MKFKKIRKIKINSLKNHFNNFLQNSAEQDKYYFLMKHFNISHFEQSYSQTYSYIITPLTFYFYFWISEVYIL